MSNIKLIEGAGGGGDSGSVTRTADSLLSQDYVEIVLGICEAPIKGLVQQTPGSLENFKIGDTPLQGVDGTANFSDFSVTGYFGATMEPPITLKLGGASVNVPVNVALAHDTPVTRQTPTLQRGNFDAIEIRLLFNSLSKTTDDGSFEATAHMRVQYRLSGTATWLDFENTPDIAITGKTTSGYMRELILEVPKVQQDYDIRVTKLSPDGTAGVDEVVVVVTWDSFQLVKRGTLAFDNLACMHLYGLSSNQFSSIPEFSGVYDGAIVKVPSNFNPELRTYDESAPWNGVFKDAYTNDPAWLTYDAITNPTRGMAKYYRGVTANRYEFYEASKWCSEKVSDGNGGTQFRFTFNELISDAKPGMEYVRYMAGAFNSVVLDDGNGVISLYMDRPSEPTRIFSPESVSSEGFSYSYTDITQRYNDVWVTFVNPDLDWEQDRRPATIDNTEEITKNGRIYLEFVAVGCTDAHEAIRRANYRYITATKEKEMVSFTTSRLGLFCRLFETVYIADPDADWGSSGRVKSVDLNVIQLRDPIWFPDANPRTMKVQTVSGITTLTVAPQNIGDVYSLTITSGVWPSDAQDRAVFNIEDSSSLGMAKPFKILSMEEVEGKPDKVLITAIEVYVNKYTEADNGTVSEPVKYAYTQPGEPVLPTEMHISTAEPVISTDGSIVNRIAVNWNRPTGAFTSRFEIDFKLADDSVWSTVSVQENSAFLSPVKDTATYDIRLFAISPTGNRSSKCLQDSYKVITKTGTLADPVDFVVTQVDTGWKLSWYTPTDANSTTKPYVPAYNGVEIRKGTQSANSWENLTTYETVQGQYVVIPWLAAAEHRFLIKYCDTLGNRSKEHAYLDLTIQNPSTPDLTLIRGVDVTQVSIPDTTTSQPLKDILLKQGGTMDTWATATDLATISGKQNLVTVIPNATTVSRIFVRSRDVANNLSTAAAVEIPPATGNIQDLLDMLAEGIDENALAPALLSKINLITGDANVAGSVNQRLGTAVTDLTQAISQEASTRNEAIAQAVQTVSAAYAQADATLESAIQTNFVAKSDFNTAIAQATQTIQANVGGTINAAVQTEAEARATADGHFASQYAIKVGFTSGSTAEVAGIAIAGTSSATEGSRFDMAFRANAFYFLPPSGSGNTPLSPLIYYATPTVVNGVSVASGLYVRSAFIETITADKIDTRNLTIKDANGNVIFGAGVGLSYSNIVADPNWSNSSITLQQSGGSYYLSGAGGGTSVNLNGLGYYGDAYATYGAYAGSSLRDQYGNVLYNSDIRNNDSTLQGQIASAASTANWGYISGKPAFADPNATPHQVFQQSSTPTSGAYVGDVWYRLINGTIGEIYTYTNSGWTLRTRGPRTVSASGYSAWDDSAAFAALGGVSSSQPGDMVTLYSATFSSTRMLNPNSTGWQEVVARINGALVVNGSIAAAALNVTYLSSVTALIGLLRSAPVGYDRVEVADGSITVLASSNATRVRISSS